MSLRVSQHRNPGLPRAGSRPWRPFRFALLGLGGLLACAHVPPGLAHLRLRSGGAARVPDALVVLDDVPLGTLAFVVKRGVALQAGRHRVSVTRDGYLPWDRAFESPSGGTLTLEVELTPRPD